MTRHNIPLGRIIRSDWFGLLVVPDLRVPHLVPGQRLLPAEFGDWSPSLYWITGGVTAIMLFVSVLLHELGHSVVALQYKIPVSNITLFIFGGVAQIGAEPPSAITEFRIASAGP